MRKFILGLISGFLLFGCTAAKFSYRYYALDAVSYDGFLRGDVPATDLPLSECVPTQVNRAPCITMKSDEFLKLKSDYKDMQLRLDRCGG